MPALLSATLSGTSSMSPWTRSDTMSPWVVGVSPAEARAQSPYVSCAVITDLLAEALSMRRDAVDPTVGDVRLGGCGFDCRFRTSIRAASARAIHSAGPLIVRCAGDSRARSENEKSAGRRRCSTGSTGKEGINPEKVRIYSPVYAHGSI